MTRSDRVLAQVSAGMQDSGEIREAITDAIKAAFREGDEPGLIADIAHLVAESGVDAECFSGHHRDWIAIRLLNAMERYARAALIAKAEDDIAQDDEDEDNA